MNTFFQIFAPPCRFKSAFIRVHLRFRIARTLLLLKPRRAPNGLFFCAPLLAGFHGAARWAEHRGGYGGMGSAPPLQFYESYFGNVIARPQKYIKMLVNISRFSPQSQL
jgi:hypothetical protein